MSGLHNDFSEKTRWLFSDNYDCWECGLNRPDAGHHIVGRGDGNSKLEISPLNFAPLHNFRCHIGKSFSDDKTAHYLVKTLKYLLFNNYELTETDRAFIDKYYKLYKLGLRDYYG